MTPQEQNDTDTTISICGQELYLKTDTDIIQMLKSKTNKQGYIKELIKKDIKNA